MERRLRELDDLDLRHGLGAPSAAASGGPSGQSGSPGPRRRQSNGTLPGLLVSALVVAGVVAFAPGDTTQALRGLIGLEGGDRLGDPPEVAEGSGTFAFLQTQPHSDDPVSYDPCRPIDYVVNPDGAPGNYEELVETAVEHTEEATGFRFDYQGTTDRRDWEIGGIAGRDVPVLIGWATAEEYDKLSGDVAGLGGSLAVRTPTNRMHYTTGRVVLDADVFENFEDDPSGEVLGQAIIDHEFGHLVGLDHVEDPQELMNADNVGITAYGPGDREGLAALGSVPCG